MGFGVRESLAMGTKASWISFGKGSFSDVTIEEKKREDEKTPQRRCLCCRGNGKKVDLLRFVVVDGVICFDLRKKLPGRGYYVCAQRHCIEKAFANGFKRVLKRDPSSLGSDAEAFIASVVLPGLRKRYTELLQSGYASHQLLIGSDSVEEAAKSDALGCYILATDASESTKKKYRLNAQRKGLPCVGLFDRAFYGQLFGKSDKVVLGWLRGSLCESFMPIEAAIRRLEGIREDNEMASDEGEG